MHAAGERVIHPRGLARDERINIAQHVERARGSVMRPPPQWRAERIVTLRTDEPRSGIS